MIVIQEKVVFGYVVLLSAALASASQEFVFENIFRWYGLGVADAVTGVIRGSQGSRGTSSNPLFLTPLLEAGRIKEARSRSLVWDFLRFGVKSYSGYLTVDKQFDSNMFFWFCTAQRSPDTAPVLMWLNGGPSRTSLVGAMLENGPLVLKKSMRMERRNTAWTKSFSMLYVDNPVGTGYSFTRKKEGFSTSRLHIARNLYSVVMQVFRLLPEYSNNDFYVGGQSYAGKYVPALGVYIHEQNLNITPPGIFLNFKGVYLGAGLCDPVKMMPIFADYMYNLGFLSDSDRNSLKTEITSLVEMKGPKEQLMRAMGYILIVFGDAMQTAGYESLDNALESDSAIVPLLYHLVDWMNSTSTRMALHVGAAQPTPTMLGHSFEVSDALREEFLTSTTMENAFLMDNYKVLHYSGNMDMIVSVPMTEAFLTSVPWSQQAAYNRSRRNKWRVGKELAGYFTKINNFTRVIVRNSGHMVPSDQPDWALDMMKRFVFDVPFGEEITT